MSFRQKYKQNLVVGKVTTVYVDGLEISGEVISADFLNPVDSHVAIYDSDEGKIYYIPITNRMIIVADAEKGGDKANGDSKTDDDLDEQ